MPKKKKKHNQHKRNYLLNVKTAIYRFEIVHIQHGEQQTKTKWQKNLKLVFHLSVSLTTIHVVKLIPCLQNNDDKETENGDSHAI